MLTFLRTKLRRKLLTHIVQHGEQDYYVRELAEILGEDPGNCSRELKRFAAEGILTVVIRAGAKFYQLNADYARLLELKQLLEKDTQGPDKTPVLFLCATRLRRAMLSYFIQNRGKDIYVRELAGAIQQDAGNLSRELRMFEAEGVLTSYKRARAKYYRLNEEHALVEEWNKWGDEGV